jgi:hypothetical protein
VAKLASTTTVYLNGSGSASSMSTYGILRAIRIA